MQFNLKINTDGKYRNFYGWSIISMLQDDFKFLENYIKKHNMLKEYFSPLPSSSYHVTMYNIWCNGSPLLNHQKRFIINNFPIEKRNEIEKLSREHNGFFNPNGCIDDLLYRLHFECQKDTWNDLKLQVDRVYYSGSTIGIALKKESILDTFRDRSIKICERNDGMDIYHITLAYKYKDINENDIKKIESEINILNMLLSEQTVTLKKPSVYSFSDMTKFNDIIN